MDRGSGQGEFCATRCGDVHATQHSCPPAGLYRSSTHSLSFGCSAVRPQVRERPRPSPPPEETDAPPELSPTVFAGLQGPRLLKTHAPRQLFLATTAVPRPPSFFSAVGRPAPLADGVKVVYVARAPKDACVSAYYHKRPKLGGQPFAAFAKTWLSGLYEHGGWADHLAGWRAEALLNPEQGASSSTCSVTSLPRQPMAQQRPAQR